MAEVNQQPPTKRSKLTSDKELARLWQHYQNYIDGGGSDEEEDTESSGGDIDELYEIISILSSRTITPVSTDITNDGDAVVLLSNIQHLLSVLLSMTYLHLANYSITTHMEDNDDNDTSPEHYFEKALHYWPSNPAALSLLANYHRMNYLSPIKDICQLYVKAAESSRCWRDIGIKFLQSSIDEDDMLDGIDIKEMVEVLIVNGALEIDFIEGEEDEVGDEDANEDAPDEYSCSEVECTSSFMSAFLLSTMNQHDDALVHLQKFKNLTYRIHPNVWKATSSTLSHNQNDSETKTSLATTSVLFEPKIYRGNDTNGILPTDLYKSLCSLFGPDAPYWLESDYQNRGYYSFFTLIEKEKPPKNVIEDVIMSHLLPLAEQECSDESIVGVEWWVHTRPTGNNLGHPIHFDTDESLLARGKVSHPDVSSVLYLTGVERDKETNSASAGPTIVFDQTPDSTTVASKAWISTPQDNSFLVFLGNLLHGVLPCSGGCSVKQTDKENENHRLTLMVGFWTRDVTIGMNERNLYSACGPLPPPSSSEHSWVLQSQNGYLNKTKPQGEETISDLSKYDVLKCISPAWEKFKEDDSATLTIPRGLDHRYFVSNAPHCFYNDLFEK